jgi:hypothetical protein
MLKRLDDNAAWITPFIFGLILAIAVWSIWALVTGLPSQVTVRKVKTVDIANEQRDNQARINRCWDMKGMPILNRDFMFEQCHLRERP